MDEELFNTLLLTLGMVLLLLMTVLIAIDGQEKRMNHYHFTNAQTFIQHAFDKQEFGRLKRC